VTTKINAHRSGSVSGLNAAKDVCIRDHEFDEVNTYVNKAGHRVCRACAREKTRKRRAARAAAD